MYNQSEESTRSLAEALLIWASIEATDHLLVNGLAPLLDVHLILGSDTDRTGLPV